MWSTPDSFSMPLALASASVSTNEFSVRSARYGVYLVHQEPCSLIKHHATDPMPYPRGIPCDVDITIRRGPLLLFEQHTTTSTLMHFGSVKASYDLGYFESGMRGKLSMIVSNSAIRHDDSVCHARVEVIEILLK
jgi:hypothetical protein